jgi:hypothetical protein
VPAYGWWDKSGRPDPLTPNSIHRGDTICDTRLPRIDVSRLLKSCAIPPVSWSAPVSGLMELILDLRHYGDRAADGEPLTLRC